MRHRGNGNTEFNILIQEIEKGHVIFSPENLLDIHEQFSAHLSLSLTEWLKKNPCTVRAALPISDRSGQTIILHVWYN